MFRWQVVSVSNMSILSGLQFPLTALVTSVITKGEQRRLTDGEQIGAAFVGGALSGLVGGPMELVMIQQQRFGTSLISTPAKVIKEASGSPLGLFRGLPMTMGREGVFTAGMLGLGPSLKRYLSACAQGSNARGPAPAPRQRPYSTASFSSSPTRARASHW